MHDKHILMLFDHSRLEVCLEIVTFRGVFPKTDSISGLFQQSDILQIGYVYKTQKRNTVLL